MSNNLSLDFSQNEFQPLAARMRPTTLAQYIGQQHLLAAGKPLPRAIEAGQLHSMILWGPPGTGKTTLAELIGRYGQADVERISAVTSGIKEIREAIERARQNRDAGRRTILFVDEVHRFNKSQQDAFLPHIEDGTITFIGATTENPSFELNSALLSRARVYLLKALTAEDIGRAGSGDERQGARFWRPERRAAGRNAPPAVGTGGRRRAPGAEQPGNDGGHGGARRQRRAGADARAAERGVGRAQRALRQ